MNFENSKGGEPMAVDARVKTALRLKSLKLPPKPRVIALRAEDYTDWTGDDALRVWVTIDEKTTDEELFNGRAVGQLKDAIRTAIRESGIPLFLYITLGKPSEFAETDDVEERALHLDLFRQARQLATIAPMKPRRANLCRAVSATYYALFHALVDGSCRMILGAGNAEAPYRYMVGRAFVHGVMKQACAAFGGGTLKAAVVKGLPTSFSIPRRSDS